MEYTKAQRRVIDTRDRDILVSAAAGSGKTAVLVERIITRVTDRSAPIDIDRILVVTFTKAAAKEMRNRIYAALERLADEDHQNERMDLQMSLLNNAAITTIDGFCSRLIKNHFHEIGLDPQVHVGDEGELALLYAETMEEMLEEEYANADVDFLDFADTFAGSDRDNAIAQIIGAVYDKSRSYPFPEEWIDHLADAYMIKNSKELQKTEWMKGVVSYAQALAADIKKEAGELLLELVSGERHPYADAVESDLAVIEGIMGAKDYNELYEIFCSIRFAALSRKKIKDEDPDEREGYKRRRDAIKKELQGMGKELFADPPEQILSDMKLMAPRIGTLISLARKFGRRYSEEKRRRMIMDFSDLEHFALSILVDEDTKERTKTAEALSQFYEEILVDEYQDSNYLQEILLSSLARKEGGRHDYFMVGDVKQSIYRFRQARPDIFTDKYKLFADENEDWTVIDLDANFRSRREVTKSVNAVFEAVMHEDMGGVEYDAAARLKYSAVIYQDDRDLHPVEDPFRTEIIIADKEGEKEGGFSDRNAYEAAVIAGCIKRLLRDGCVTDEETGSARRIRLSDIVILHRSANAIANVYQETLGAYDIPAHIISTTGYFSTVEVEGVLSLLKVLDNPRQDIALAATLRSAFFNVSDDTLARAAAEFSEERFYRAVMLAKDAEGFPEIREAMEKLSEWRKRSSELKLYELLEMIMDESGYLTYVRALPGGDVRRANVEKLISLAVGYEESSYKGLFNFTRYIEKLVTYEQDFGQENISDSGESVSIMTIHKSKGLEFPVVILAGMGTAFVNDNSRMVLHQSLGVAFDAIDIKRRTKKKSLYKSYLRKLNALDDKGEGLRVLYVAMTRAKEKLVMTGVLKDAHAAFDRVKSLCDMPLLGRMHAKNYFDWVLPVAKGRGELFDITITGTSDLVMDEVREKFDRRERLAIIEEQVGRVSDESIEELYDRLEFSYAHKSTKDLKVKYSVSELKHRAMPDSFKEDDSIELFTEEEEEDEYIPAFLAEDAKGAPKGSDRGTAMHRYMECFDFSLDDYRTSYEREKERMINTGLLKEDDVGLLLKEEIESFLESDLASRMHRASAAGRLKKEAAFVMGDTPQYFGMEDGAAAGDDIVLIQGIIDVFFEEDDGIVLLDYKTDRIQRPSELADRYKKQIELYADALVRTLQKPVKEKILYSFAKSAPVVIE